MNEASPQRSRRRMGSLSLRKKVAFSAVIVFILILFIEVCAFASLRYLEGTGFSISSCQDERNKIAALKVNVQDVVRGEQLRPEAGTQYRALHPYVGFVQRLDVGSVQVPDGPLLHVNEFGYRDEADPIHKRSADKVIIAILGGSVANGFGRIGAVLLERHLRQSERYADKEFVFVRLAVPGYRQPQQLMTIAYLLSLGAQFDIVINIDGFNEVALYPAENAKNHVFPAYPRHWYYRLARLPDEQVLSYHALRKQRRELAVFFSRPLLKRSLTCNLTWKLRDRELDRQIVEMQDSLAALSSDAQPYEATGPRRQFANPESMVSELVDNWRRSTIQLDRLCRSNDIDYFHFLQPNQYVAGSKEMGKIEKQRAFREDHPVRAGVEIGYPMMMQAGPLLEEMQIHFTDLTQVFANRREPIYIDDCCHFNRLGFELVAAEVSRVILSAVDSI